jgi:hypothetical protein
MSCCYGGWSDTGWGPGASTILTDVTSLVKELHVTLFGDSPSHSHSPLHGFMLLPLSLSDDTAGSLLSARPPCTQHWIRENDTFYMSNTNILHRMGHHIHRQMATTYPFVVAILACGVVVTVQLHRWTLTDEFIYVQN